MTDTKAQIQESQRAPSKINAKKKKKATPGHIIFKVRKSKIKKNIERNQRGENTFPIEEQR